MSRNDSLPEWERVLASAAHLQCLDGIETGIRQLIREQPLESMEITVLGQKVIVPTIAEMLRIKAALILKRNATRDYIDFVALADRMGMDPTVVALERFDELYPQPNGESAMQQLEVQLANPMPFDLDSTRLSEYKNLDPKWQDWLAIKARCAAMAVALFDAGE